MQNGSTALHEAIYNSAKYGSSQIFSLLLDAGADPTLKNEVVNADPAQFLEM